MAINVQIERNGTENSMSVLRRFRNRVRSSGVLMKSRGGRFHSRALSEFTKKKQRLGVLDRKAKIERLVKLGKIAETPSRRS